MRRLDELYLQYPFFGSRQKKLSKAYINNRAKMDWYVSITSRTAGAESQT